MPSRAAASDVFEPWQLGDFALSHRIVLRAAAQHRARPIGVPTSEMADGHGRLGSDGGLVMCETAAVSPGGLPELPGLYSAEQVNHWRMVTEAIHERGGIAIAQLGLGALHDAAGQGAFDHDALEQRLLDYRTAAENAGDAGFDGVELQVAHGSLPDRLLHAELPRCAEAYRGRPEACLRFVDEALHSLIGVWGLERVGLCLAPRRFVAGVRILAQDGLTYYARLLRLLDRIGIAWLSVMEPLPTADAAGTAMPTMAMLLRPHYGGALLVDGGADITEARLALQRCQAQGVVLGAAVAEETGLLRKLGRVSS